MSLSDLVKSVVSTAKAVTADLQASITLEAFSADDAYGNRTYGAGASYKVILQNRERFVTAQDRTQQLSKMQIQFLEAVQVKVQDRITLPDGSQPEIMAIEGVFDPDGSYYAPTVFF